LCIYANAFVAGRNNDSLVLPKSPEGLRVTLEGVFQSKFVKEFNDDEGVFLGFHDGHCLCQYDDWSTFFKYIDEIRQANNVDKVPVMVFGTGIEYPESSMVELDLELDDVSETPEHGSLIFVAISIGRRLAKNVGKQVSILYKSGKTVIGTLKEFNEEGAYGEIDTKGESVYFRINEIWHVDVIV
jgi:hypothetical protein